MDRAVSGSSMFPVTALLRYILNNYLTNMLRREVKILLLKKLYCVTFPLTSKFDVFLFLLYYKLLL